ncbi:MAG: SapC family protein [Pseudomonadota bacterium]
MSDIDADAAAETPAARMPLFYARPEVLEAKRHGALRLKPHPGFGFAAEANAIPLNVAEFAKAAVDYPIVFAGTTTLAPLAVTGLRARENLFVDAQGDWAPGAYVPAYARRYPFILTRPRPDADQVMLCMDMESARVGGEADEDAATLFEEGGPSEHAKNAMNFCLEFQRHAAATEEIAEIMRQEGLLAEQSGKVELSDGEQLRLTDFQIVDEKKLNALPGERLDDLRRKGVLGAAYCQLVSMNNWPKLSRLAEARKP